MGDRLFMLPDADRSHDSITALYDFEIKPYLTPGGPRLDEWVVEEWTALTADHALPDPTRVAEQAAEDASDDMDGEGRSWVFWEAASDAPEVVEAFRAALLLMASKVDYRVCGKKIGEHLVTFDATGRPLVDGDPMHGMEATDA